MALRVLAACAFLIGLGEAASAQARPREALPPIDPRITKLVTAGFWKTGTRHGFFRAVELSDGWEEIRRQVVVQWLADPEERGTPRVVASYEFRDLAQSVWSVSDPALASRAGRWILTVRTTARPLEQPDGTRQFELGAPGTVRAVGARYSYCSATGFRSTCFMTGSSGVGGLNHPRRRPMLPDETLP